MHLFAVVFAVVTLPVGFFSVLAWAAAWGYAASWLNEVIKQDGFPKPVNTVIANAVVLVGATFTALLTSPGQTLTWSLFLTALLGAFQTALINHTLFLEPTGIGAAIKRATSIVAPRTSSSRTTGAYPAPGPGTVATSAAKKTQAKRPVRSRG